VGEGEEENGRKKIEKRKKSSDRSERNPDERSEEGTPLEKREKKIEKTSEKGITFFDFPD
jgi:hypothetical protein